MCTRRSGEDVRPQTAYDTSRLQHVSSRYLLPLVSSANYIRLVEAVKDAIADGIHPKMISKGSSGSYFARARIDGKVQTVA
jgi:hypothetical protein